MTFEELLAIGGAWAWANYGKDVVKDLGKELIGRGGSTAKNVLTSGWDRVEWNLAAKKYRKKILDLHGSIRVLGKADPIPLEGIFTDVFILDRPTAHKRFDITHLRREPELLNADKRHPALSLVSSLSGRRLFILGKPGSGKTTFLKYVTVEAANGALDKIPIFISLERWANSGLPLMEFISTQFEICDFPDAEQFVVHILKKGDAIVMFDGLDEVRQEAGERARMISLMRDFCNQYSNTQCLVTCRIAAVEYEFETFTYVELADFSTAQIDSFVTKWFAQEPEKLSLFKKSFEEHEFRGLRELAKTPLLLALLCLSFSETMTFPERRSEIYEEAVDALLKKWDAMRSIQRDEIYYGLSLGRKRQMLSRLAAQAFQMNEYFLPQKQLAKNIAAYLQRLPGGETADSDDGEAVLKAIEAQHSILVERAHRIYSFSHLTLQEYFTARYICDHGSSRTLTDLLQPRYVPDPRWREVILMTAGMLENADEFFRVFETTLGKLIEGDELLTRFFAGLNDPKENTTDETCKGVLFCCILLGILGVNSLNVVRDYLGTMTDKLLKRLGVRFTFPRFEEPIVDYFGGKEISNLSEILAFKFGPRYIATGNHNRDVDLNLLYCLLLSQSMMENTVFNPKVNEKVLEYFEAVLRLIQEEGNTFLASGWQFVMTAVPNTYWAGWSEVRDLLETQLKTNWRIGKAWALSDEQGIKAKDYIYSRDLLRECLRLAAVTSRKELEARYGDV